MILNIVISILWVVIYSYWINPGQGAKFYGAYAIETAPYSSIIAGMPLMFLAGRWIGGKFPKGNSVNAALLVWLVYVLIDITVIALTGNLIGLAPLFAASFATKLGAAYLGGLSAARRGAYLKG